MADVSEVLFASVIRVIRQASISARTQDTTTQKIAIYVFAAVRT
jgi:hypothetical protein